MSTQKSYFCLTCDVEGNPKKWFKELAELVNTVNKLQTKVTFFVALDEGRSSLTTYEKMSNILHSLAEEGHEVGLHIHWGSWKVASKIKEDFVKGVKLCKSYTKSLRSFTREEIEQEVEYYLEIMDELGFSPHSFRGGGLCQTTVCLKVLAEHGFEVDSSVAPGLNEKTGWFQNHTTVPNNKGFYYPSKIRYDLPAKNALNRIGILEVPVTSAVPSDRSWDSVLSDSLLTAESFTQIHKWAVSHQNARAQQN